MDVIFLCEMEMMVLVNSPSQGYSEEQNQSVCETLFKKSETQYKVSANMEAKKTKQNKNQMCVPLLAHI